MPELRPDRPLTGPDSGLDSLLDAALSRFSRVEPPPGAAERWLAGAPAVARERARHPRAWLAFAATFAAGIIVAGVVFLGSHSAPAARPTRATAVFPMRPSAPKLRAAAVAAASRLPVRPPGQNATASAWRPFPLPENLTPQERLALALTQPPAAAPGEPAASLVILAAPLAMYKPIEIRPLSLVDFTALADDAVSPAATPADSAPDPGTNNGGNHER